MPSCVFPECDSTSKNCKLSFFEIPVKHQIREKWIQIISHFKNKANQSWTPHDRDVVCSKHFFVRDFQENKNKKMLKPSALPIVFSNYSKTLAPIYEKNFITCVKVRQINIPICNPFCRLCGSKNDQVMDIFSNEAMEHDIPNLIRMYLPIEVSKNDNRSSSICYQCISALIAWHELYLQTLRVDQDLNSRLPSTVQEDVEMEANIETGSKDIPESVLNVPDTGDSTIRVMEKSNETLEESENMPVAENNEDPPAIDSASLDLLVFEEKENSIILENNSHQMNAPASPTPEDRLKELTQKPENDRTFNYSVVRLYQCNICNEISRTNEDFRKHMATHRSTRSYNCSICGTTFNLKKVMESHIRNTHTFRKRRKRSDSENLEERTCFHCCRKLVNKATLISHLKSLHWDGRVFICDICEVQFQELTDFQKHVQETNHRTDGFVSKQCASCGLDFGSRIRFRIHVASKHEGGLKCTACDVILQSYLELQDHEAIHPHLRPYKCEYCGKNFKRSGDQKKHLMVHTGERPHVCEVCGKNFNRKHNMHMHRRSHYGDKPFTCPHCDMSFSRVGDLRKHKQLHYLKNQAKS